jgi:glutathione S-transferase
MALINIEWLAFQSTLLITFILFIKFFLTACIQSSKRTAAGTRPPEDFKHKKDPGANFSYNTHPVTDATLAAYEADARWRRIVANDLENLPYGMIIATLAMLSASSGIAHVVLYALFGFFRVLHTIAYALALQPVRSIAYVMAVLCVLGIAINGIVGIWHR